MGFILDTFFGDEGWCVDHGGISDFRIPVPNLDKTEFGFGTDSDTVDFDVIAAEGLPHSHENDVHEESIHFIGVNFDTPGTTITVIFRFPDRLNTLSHQEEHTIENVFFLEKAAESTQFFHGVESN